MLKFFQRSFPLQFFIIFISGIILWMPVFIGCSPEIAETYLNGSLSVFIWNIYNELPDFIVVFVSYFLVFITGILVNNMVSKENIIDKNSLTILFLYILLSSLFPGEVAHSSLPLAGVLLYPFFKKVIKHEEVSGNYLLSYDTGLILGIISLFYYPLISGFLFIWLSFLIIKGLGWRNYVTSFLGVLTPLSVEYFYSFFSGKEKMFINRLTSAFTVKNVSFDILHSSFGYLLVSLLIIAIIGGLISLNLSVKMTVKQRKIMSVFGMYSVFFSLLIILFNGENTFYLLLPSIAVIYGYFLEGVSENKKVNILMISVIISVLVNNWFICFV